MKTSTRKFLSCALAVLFLAVSLFGADATLRGLVTDASGKPIRGAIVKATLGPKSISRFTQKDGRYKFRSQPGSYQLSVDAYGYGVKFQTKDTTQAGDTNFTLTPKWDATRLTGADITPLVPDDAQGKLHQGRLHRVPRFQRRAAPAGNDIHEWQSFLPDMPGGKRPPRNWSSAELRPSAERSKNILARKLRTLDPRRSRRRRNRSATLRSRPPY